MGAGSSQSIKVKEQGQPASSEQQKVKSSEAAPWEVHKE